MLWRFQHAKHDQDWVCEVASRKRLENPHVELRGKTQEAFHPRMYSTGIGRCPVPLRSICHCDFLISAFLNHHCTYKNHWTTLTRCGTSNSQLERKSLESLWKPWLKSAGLQRSKTNPSARKTVCARLISQNVTPTHVAQLSGHINFKAWTLMLRPPLSNKSGCQTSLAADINSP